MIKTITYLEQPINYKIHGNGKPVILLHGFGEDSSIFDNIIPTLHHQNTVVVLDLPGCGINLGAIAPITIDDCADIVHAIVQKENFTDIALFGHSMGGYIALAYAKLHTATLRSIGLLHSTAFADTKEKKIIRQKNIDFIQEYGSALFLKQTIPNLFAQKYVEENVQFVKDFSAKMGYLTKEVLANYTKAMMLRTESVNFLTTSNLPFLFIIGTEDNAVPFASSMQQCYLPKTSYFHIMNGVGHMGMFELPERFLKITTDFLHEV